MAKESAFVDLALDVACDILKPPLSIRRSAALLYQVTVDNQLNLTVNPKRPRSMASPACGSTDRGDAQRP